MTASLAGLLPAAFVHAAAIGATIYLCLSMSGSMAMPGGWAMSMAWMRMPGQSWQGAAAMFFAMWLAMMVAMKLPSSLPALRRLRDRFEPEGRGRKWRMSRMLAGYWSVWAALGIAVYAAGVALATAAMKWPAVSHAVPAAAGAALVAAGAFQFTPWKMAALRICRDPGVCAFAASDGEPLEPGRIGLRMGAACVRCCAGLMLAQVVLGVMNLAAMVVIAAVIALEKLAPRPELAARLSGLAAVAAGAFVIARSL